MQGFFILADMDDLVLVGVRFGKVRFNGILQSVLHRLICNSVMEIIVIELIYGSNYYREISCQVNAAFPFQAVFKNP